MKIRDYLGIFPTKWAGGPSHFFLYWTELLTLLTLKFFLFIKDLTSSTSQWLCFTLVVKSVNRNDVELECDEFMCYAEREEWQRYGSSIFGWRELTEGRGRQEFHYCQLYRDLVANLAQLMMMILLGCQIPEEPNKACSACFLF